MSDSRLYYDIKPLHNGKVQFYYYTIEINKNVYNLKSYTKCLSQKDMLLVSNINDFNNLLNIMNTAEFSRFLIEFKNTKDEIDILSQNNSSTKNRVIAKLWGLRKLRKKFTDWFSNNKYPIPNKYQFVNKEQLTTSSIQVS